MLVEHFQNLCKPQYIFKDEQKTPLTKVVFLLIAALIYPPPPLHCKRFLRKRAKHVARFLKVFR